ncbi:entericidin A/B family lipoprotein [Halomonas qinghailakensis]|uniref:Entericidin A/B family lipoprotein n=1 Tax=Halomonas qinghailakensis TaxID=2937790 RepID=A0AA46TSJ8_9GAMM|nr:entericidin A/B family lipoprotein [Halomonas sp. ZZQ-149]UYO75783.1 entericidin A/B family lipoprotein [Halomonas sp. ZZQ-149]
MKRTLATLLLIIVTLVSISGCNTIRGAGEDIERGGEAIQRSASS